MSEIRKHQCPSCGGNLTDDNQMYRCSSCGSAFDYDYFREDRLLGMGETYLSRGEINAAVDAYRLKLKNAPQDFLALRGLMLSAARLKDMDDLISAVEVKHFAYNSKMVREVLDDASEEDKGYFEDLARIYYRLKELSDRNAEIKSLIRSQKRLENTIRLEEQDTYNYKISGGYYSGKDPVPVFVALWLLALGLFLIMLCLVIPLAVSGEGVIALIVGLVFAFFIGLTSVVNMTEIYPEVKDEKDMIAYVKSLRVESEANCLKIRKLETEVNDLSDSINASIRDFVENDRLMMTGPVKEQATVPKTGKIMKHQCPSCGGGLRIDSDKQMYHCTFCGSTYDYEYFREDRIHEAGETYLSRGEFMATTEAYEFMLKKDPHDFLALRGLMLAAAHLTSVSELDQLNKEEKFSYDPDMARQATENASEEDKEYFKEFGRVYADKQRLNDCLEEIESLREKKRKNSSLITRKNVERASYFVKGELAASGNLRTAYIVIWIVNAFFLLMLILSVIGLVKDYAADPASLGGSLEMVLFLAAVNAALLIYNHVANFSKLIKVNKIEKDISALYVEAGKIDEQIRDLENESDDLLSDIKRSIHDFVRKDRLVMREKKMS